MSLEGRVAVVADGGSELGRAVALALSARGVRVVVSGASEKTLGETVGHVVFGGGKARHVVGTAADAAARAREVFGPVDIVVGDATVDAPRRIVVVAPDEVEADDVAALVVGLCAGEITGRVLTLTVG